jgi:hypothetical protein
MGFSTSVPCIGLPSIELTTTPATSACRETITSFLAGESVLPSSSVAKPPEPFARQLP